MSCLSASIADKRLCTIIAVCKQDYVNDYIYSSRSALPYYEHNIHCALIVSSQRITHFPQTFYFYRDTFHWSKNEENMSWHKTRIWYHQQLIAGIRVCNRSCSSHSDTQLPLHKNSLFTYVSLLWPVQSTVWAVHSPRRPLLSTRQRLDGVTLCTRG